MAIEVKKPQAKRAEVAVRVVDSDVHPVAKAGAWLQHVPVRGVPDFLSWPWYVNATSVGVGGRPMAAPQTTRARPQAAAS